MSALAAAAMPSLKLAESSSTKHKEVVTGVDWSAANELLSVSDDKTVWLWNIDGEPQAQILTIDSFCTGLLWAPGGQGKADSFVVGCTDGSFKLVSRRGQIEKSVPAHQGAVTCVRWSHDNTSLATCGEDGVVKSWSRVGMFRANLGQGEGTVYTLCWSPESDQVLFSSGKHLIIRPLTPSSKQTQWKAHDAPVLQADWNPVNNLIVSGGEDCKCVARNSARNSSAAQFVGAQFVGARNPACRARALPLPPQVPRVGRLRPAALLVGADRVLGHVGRVGAQRPLLCGGLVQHAPAVRQDRVVVCAGGAELRLAL